ncbi:hypothetical protein THIOSC15_3100007 [uncultured Thiomicrorhabdus sp.]
MAEFYYLAVNQLPIETDRVYDINIDTNFFTATGLKLGYQGRWQKFDCNHCLICKRIV